MDLDIKSILPVIERISNHVYPTFLLLLHDLEDQRQRKENQVIEILFIGGVLTSRFTVHIDKGTISSLEYLYLEKERN